jgi:hypothetical protein
MEFIGRRETLQTDETAIIHLQSGGHHTRSTIEDCRAIRSCFEGTGTEEMTATE